MKLPRKLKKARSKCITISRENGANKCIWIIGPMNKWKWKYCNKYKPNIPLLINLDFGEILDRL